MSEVLTSPKRVSFVFAGLILAGSATALSQGDPSVILNDGGVHLPDGTVQSTSEAGPPTQVAQTGKKASGAQRS